MLKPTSGRRADAYESVFGALAHPARRRVLLAVYFNGGATTAGEIAAIFAHAWQTTTRHLQVLEAAGLLKHERQGRMRIYHIERQRLALVSEWLTHFQKPVRHLKRAAQDVKNKDTKGPQGRRSQRPRRLTMYRSSSGSTSRSMISTQRSRSIRASSESKGGGSPGTDATSSVAP